jgi:UDP-glucose 4-epimerase
VLTHTFHNDSRPAKAVVMGAGGFVGAHIVGALRAAGVASDAVTRTEVDLLRAEASSELARRLSSDTALIVTSAKAPCKDYRSFHDNIAMMAAVCDAVRAVPPAHLLYISSDAVYADSATPLTERSPMGALNTHGMMHAAREVMLTDACGGAIPLAFLRPTLIYGADDPHNGYGPNRFRRNALAGEDIVLFGEGEERRDHVAVEDVAELARRIVMRRSVGALNAATGTTISFGDLARLTADLAETRVTVRGTERTGPMPHNGYRAFDPAATHAAFPDFTYADPEAGVRRAFELVAGNRDS